MIVLRVFENIVVREILGSKWDEVRRNWRRLQIEELNVLHSAPPIIRVIKSRRIRLAVNVARTRGEMHTGFWWDDLEVRRPLGRPRRRWEDNIKMDLQEVGCRSMDWIDVAQDRDSWRALVNAVMNLRIP